jgi:chemotaxis signal transduction protein
MVRRAIERPEDAQEVVDFRLGDEVLHDGVAIAVEAFREIVIEVVGHGAGTEAGAGH